VLKNEQGLPSPTNNFPKTYRLYGRKAIRKVVYDGEKLNGKTLRINYIKAETTKFAISVPKGYGKAVVRNRIKRVIREFLRQNKGLWPKSHWVIIKALKKPEREVRVIEDLKNLLSLIK
jgi:ribonuclease P protein component